ncbi:hypothetical protein J1N35_035563 [Gossypium stocksii]|uniref:Uncharacterized protein n=1 Tax=Gossypium stocksii TaxID=47602 RepID=A0A9D3UU58_9ROSI|nr:hypothetical protein J1N35_035563 [Gossypium stocksii]
MLGLRCYALGGESNEKGLYNPALNVRCSFAAFHRASFKMDTVTRNWVKVDHPNPQKVDNEGLEEEHDEILPTEQAPPPTSLSAQPSAPSHSGNLAAAIFSVFLL